MSNSDGDVFLQWCLPRLRMRFEGFRKVRGQVLKRVKRRIKELGLQGYGEYRDHLEVHGEEWERLDALCRITISRFYRDRGVFEFVFNEILPLSAGDAGKDGRSLRCWSAGCASGEETYTFAILWETRLAQRFQDLALEIVATDADEQLLARARRGCYTAGSLKELPAEWRNLAFERRGEEFCLHDRYRRHVTFLNQDIREQVPGGPFDLVLCRNLAFTYFEESLQTEVAQRLCELLRPGGALVLGKHERLPGSCAGYEPWQEHMRIYRRVNHPD